jgi:hypothetical protein
MLGCIDGVTTLRRNDVLRIVQSYMEQRTPQHRYASFDYCYRYFRTTSSKELLQNLEQSCLALGFYLASWGMFRGKSNLLQCSARHYVPIIEYVAEQPPNTWELDICTCDLDGIEKLRDIYRNIRSRVASEDVAHLTLVTKIMLGVFGTVPAFDRYFGDAFRAFSPSAKFRTFGKGSLLTLQDFYCENRPAIEDAAATYTVLSFHGDSEPKLNYTRAKVLDMYGFTLGGGGNAT